MVEIIRYESLEKCVAAFLGCSPEEIPDGKWWWAEEDGSVHAWPMSRVLRVRRKRGTWGWCEDKKVLHLWVAPYAEFKCVLRLVAHELGHTKRPYRRLRSQEEAKADTYANVAVLAYGIATELVA